MLDLEDLMEEGDGRFNPTPSNIKLAREIAFAGWKGRARERGLGEPEDLSRACKFCSLFARHLFGGEIRGNEEHQFLVLPSGDILDLGEGAQDILALEAPYAHDPAFWGCPDHLESLESCLPRVESWVRLFETCIIAAPEGRSEYVSEV